MDTAALEDHLCYISTPPAGIEKSLIGKESEGSFQ